ncbi:MAG: ComF family protein [Pedobacter sp.]|nr:ComF family protein [Pedobacter sp.]MDQ8052909.1 ComF family protein [Pedobacter sp.]
MNALQRLMLDFVALLFPELCPACGTGLHHGEGDICLHCLFDLPYTDYHLHQDNRVARQFWGRLPLHAAMAMLYFKKGTKVQHLVHHLKYKGRTAVGIKLGQLLAERLKQSEQYQDVDLIIPVPLHPKKQKLRGYNQSEYIAKGMAEEMNIPFSTLHLRRLKASATQTKKSRYYRYENMRDIFSLSKAEQMQDLHILLVDDVVTTGATLEACGQVLLNSPIKKLSIAAVAFAE